LHNDKRLDLEAVMRRIRLDPDAYTQGHCFSVTITVADRFKLFNQPHRGEIAIQALRDAADKYGAQVFAYCLMPDHFHFLVAPPESVSLIEFVRLVKQLSSFRLKKLPGKPVPVWQTRFYDHGLRKEETLEDVANYIWNNPVRAGIVSHAEDYPYSGRFVFEFAQSGSKDARPTMAAT
jgi:REP element-mobilizing transposase RayT